MTFDDINPLLRYWKLQPPAHVILAAVHMKKQKTQPRKGVPQMEHEGGSTEMELVAAGIMTVNRKPKDG